MSNGVGIHIRKRDDRLVPLNIDKIHFQLFLDQVLKHWNCLLSHNILLIIHFPDMGLRFHIYYH